MGNPANAIFHDKRSVLDLFQQLARQPFPFPVKAGLEPLRRFLRQKLSEQEIEGAYAAALLAQLEAASSIDNDFDPEAHRGLLAAVMDSFFPVFQTGEKLGYLILPFHYQFLYRTPGIDRLLMNPDLEIEIDAPAEMMTERLIYNACTLILMRLYGVNTPATMPSRLTVRHRPSGMETHYQVNLVPDFVDVRPRGELPDLSPEAIRELLYGPRDMARWLTLLPPEAFQFEGMVVIYLNDITEQEVLSRLKNYLLGYRLAAIGTDREVLQRFLRSYFRRPALRMGMTGIDDFFRQLHAIILEWQVSLLGDEWASLADKVDIRESVYEWVFTHSEALVVHDLRDWPTPTRYERRLLETGVRSLIIMPLRDKNDRVMGAVEVADAEPNAFDMAVHLKLRELQPLLDLGVNRKRDYLEDNIRGVMQQQFTNIHNSILWKFRQAAIDMLIQRQREAGSVDPPDIAFRRVYPFYGQADIVGSSVRRNEAIRADLIENLEYAAVLVEALRGVVRSYLLDHIDGQIGEQLLNLRQQFSPTDESGVLELLTGELHPFLQQLREDYGERVEAPVAAYFARLDPTLGFVYHRRRAFEESVAELNRVLSVSLEEADRQLQEALPHYFEKYSTDGVEYTIYAGQSMLQERRFSPAHLREFRLWQLVLMCELTREMAALEPRLPMPLTTAQLIFVYSDPLDIRFRLDEKQFDVDGAYNVRYEILKKRIDKAYIEGADERLTRSGHLAIVYLHARDRQEYIEYLAYLRRRGYITGDVEDLPLADMQGVEGLRALRVRVAIAP